MDIVDHIVDHIGGPIAWREAGTGQPILFLHGLGGSRYAWEAQLESLAPLARCIAWDMPGYGASRPIEPLTFPAIVDAIIGLLDRLELATVDVVGLSFGGQQAMHLAIDHPDRVRRLVLADTSPRFGADGTEPETWKRARLGAIDGGRTPADFAPAALDAISAPGFAGIERARAIAAFAHISSDAFRASVECLPSHDVSARLNEIAAPTIVVVGEHDNETPVSYAEVIAGSIPNAMLKVIPDAGHLTPAEQPEEFNHVLFDFLVRM